MIPSKRPRVTVDLFGSQRWQADCYVPGCRWGYGNVIKSDVQHQASMHRQHHREAVPDTHVEQFASGYWQGHCAPCGWWTDGPGLTKAQAQTGVDYHLSTEHGVVSCA